MLFFNGIEGSSRVERPKSTMSRPQSLRHVWAVLKKNGVTLSWKKVKNLLLNIIGRQVVAWVKIDVRLLLRETSIEGWSATASQWEVRNRFSDGERVAGIDEIEHEEVNLGDVYQMWWQGFSKRPPIVERCMESFVRHSDRRVHKISRKNLDSYVDLPGYIHDKQSRGAISLAHFSDLVRCEILGTSGGTWVDATVFFGGNGDELLSGKDFFAFRTTPQDLGGNPFRLFATWYMHVRPFSDSRELFQATREFLLEFWKKNEKIRHYFLLNHYLSSLIHQDVTNFDKSSLDSINKFDVSAHLLLHNWHKEYHPPLLASFFSDSLAQKLTYDLRHGLPDGAHLSGSSIQSFLLASHPN